MGPKLPHHFLGQVGGHGKADPLPLAADGGVDADHAPLQVEQRAARVAGVDRGIGLEKLAVGHVFRVENIASLGADYPHGNAVLKAERAPDGHHPIPDPDVAGIAEGHLLQPLGGDLDEREVGAGVRTDDAAFVLGPSGKGDVNHVRPFNHVVVGEDQPVGADDHAGAQSQSTVGKLKRLQEFPFHLRAPVKGLSLDVYDNGPEPFDDFRDVVMGRRLRGGHQQARHRQGQRGREAGNFGHGGVH